MTTKTATIYFSHTTTTIELDTTVLMDLVNMAHNRLTDRQKATKEQAAELDFKDRGIAHAQVDVLLDQHQDAELKIGVLDRIKKAIKAAPEVTAPSMELDCAKAAATLRRFAEMVEGERAMPLPLLHEVGSIVQSFPPF